MVLTTFFFFFLFEEDGLCFLKGFCVFQPFGQILQTLFDGVGIGPCIGHFRKLHVGFSFPLRRSSDAPFNSSV
jgi:hypothetical protein